MMNFADQLLAAAADASLSPAELRAWMRRAALRIQRTELEMDADYLTLINEARAIDGEPPLDAKAILKDWAEARGIVAIDDLDEDTGTKGSV